MKLLLVMAALALGVAGIGEQGFAAATDLGAKKTHKPAHKKPSLTKPANGKPTKANYWTDIVDLCMAYTGATRPPCNVSNGAKMILDHVRHNCKMNKDCLNKAVQLCVMYSPATRPPCNKTNGIDMVTGELERVASFYRKPAEKKDAITDYWTDIVDLCRNYSGATHPPCNKTNGAKMILDHVAHNCEGDNECLEKAVSICIQYSPATRPPCNASNGLKMVLGEVERISKFHDMRPTRKKDRWIDNVDEEPSIDIHEGEPVDKAG